jgi:nitrogen regulatory protein P-II 1
MKKIEAIVPMARLYHAFDALKELNLGGLTYYDSKGRGEIPRRPRVDARGTGTYVPPFNPNSTIVIVTDDATADKVVEKIVQGTSSGLKGEGKIFVSDIDDVIDIGTKARGQKAL